MSDITDLEDKLKKEKVEVPVDVAIYIGILKDKTKADKQLITDMMEWMNEVSESSLLVSSDDRRFDIIQRAKEAVKDS